MNVTRRHFDPSVKQLTVGHMTTAHHRLMNVYGKLQGNMWLGVNTKDHSNTKSHHQRITLSLKYLQAQMTTLQLRWEMHQIVTFTLKA